MGCDSIPDVYGISILFFMGGHFMVIIFYMFINKRLAFRITNLIHFKHRKSNIVNIKHPPSLSVEGNV